MCLVNQMITTVQSILFPLSDLELCRFKKDKRSITAQTLNGFHEDLFTLKIVEANFPWRMRWNGPFEMIDKSVVWIFIDLERAVAP
jgi:hypothetical protein